MPPTASVLLIHDGELDDVRAALEQIGAEVADLRGGSVPERVEPPRDLLVTTARRARAVESWPPPRGEPARPAKIAVVTEDSVAARRMLRAMGFDFLVRRPVHPEALRLLLVRCLFRGVERRRHPRSPVGYEIGYRVGLRRSSAVLTELSPDSVGLRSLRPVPVGAELALRIPGELLGGERLTVRARVIRSDERRRADGTREFALALVLDPGAHAARRRLEELLWSIQSGPPTLGQAVADGPASVATQPAPRCPAPRAAAPAPSSPPGCTAELPARPTRASARRERRRHPRGAFARKVLADGERATRILVGRDLSGGGMRADCDPDLAPGSRVRIAIYGASDEPPIEVEARVARNDPQGGLGLSFEAVDAETVERLERLVGSLPSVESLHEDEAGSVGTVVSRLVE
jgi:hypothetical protein